MSVKQEPPSVKLNTYHTILELARKHKAEGLLPLAESFYKQAVSIARNLDPPNPDILTEALYDLASYYHFLGKDNEAEVLWKEIEAYKEYFASNDPIYVDCVTHLAAAEERCKNVAAAEEYYIDLLERQEAELGDESLEVCSALHQLGAFYCRLGKYNIAETLYLRILVIKEFHLGTCSPEINYTVDALVDIFQKLHKWRLAEYMMNRQKAILVALHGKNSLCVASCALRLADLQRQTKQYAKAIDNLSTAIHICKNICGDLANPVLLLQAKLDDLLICGLDSAMQEVASTEDEANTISLDFEHSGDLTEYQAVNG